MNRSDEIFCFAQVADNNSAGFPLSRLRSINGGTGSLVLSIDEAIGEIDTITLTTSADELTAAMQLCRALSEATRNTESNVVVLANLAAATVTIVPEITGCSTIA
jgi:hypothetical protein